MKVSLRICIASGSVPKSADKEPRPSSMSASCCKLAQQAKACSKIKTKKNRKQKTATTITETETETEAEVVKQVDGKIEKSEY